MFIFSLESFSSLACLNYYHPINTNNYIFESLYLLLLQLSLLLIVIGKNLQMVRHFEFLQIIKLPYFPLIVLLVLTLVYHAIAFPNETQRHYFLLVPSLKLHLVHHLVPIIHIVLNVIAFLQNLLYLSRMEHSVFAEYGFDIAINLECLFVGTLNQFDEYSIQ